MESYTFLFVLGIVSRARAGTYHHHSYLNNGTSSAKNSEMSMYGFIAAGVVASFIITVVLVYIIYKLIQRSRLKKDNITRQSSSSQTGTNSIGFALETLQAPTEPPPYEDPPPYEQTTTPPAYKTSSDGTNSTEPQTDDVFPNVQPHPVGANPNEQPQDGTRSYKPPPDGLPYIKSS